MTTLLIATRNAHKVAEIQAILGTGFACRPLLAEFPAAPIAVEDADTFAGNALKKAESLSHWLAASLQAGGSRDGRPTIGATRTFVLADDSGLEVDALGGAPGVYSARFAGEPKSDARNNEKMIAELAKHEDKSAYYYCVLVFVRHADDPQPIIADGRWNGVMVDTPRGEGGFGYDPAFEPLQSPGRTMAELSGEEKDQISHRGNAVRELSLLLGDR